MILLVFGSINVDLVFEVEDLPRPGETVLCPSYTIVPGGKGANQACAAAKAGADVRFFGATGDDDHGRLSRRKLEAAGVACEGIAWGEHPTGVAVIGVERSGENAIMVASGANREVVASAIDDRHLASGTTLLCQNEVPLTQTVNAIGRARAAGAATVLNLAPAGELKRATLDDLDVLIANEHEMRTVASISPTSLLEPAVRRLAREHGLICVVTLGASGALLIAPEGGWRIGALPVDVVDTTGAGDTFSGVFAASWSAGHGLDVALHRASVAAGLACGALGAQEAQPTAADVDAALSRLEPPRPIN